MDHLAELLPSDLTLVRKDHELVILADGKALMSSRMHGSEEALATAQ